MWYCECIVVYPNNRKWSLQIHYMLACETSMLQFSNCSALCLSNTVFMCWKLLVLINSVVEFTFYSHWSLFRCLQISYQKEIYLHYPLMKYLVKFSRERYQYIDYWLMNTAEVKIDFLYVKLHLKSIVRDFKCIIR